MRVPYPVGHEPVSLVVGDFDRDGEADLVTANRGSNDVSVLLGNGDGTFQTPAINTDVLGSPSYLAVGDFDGDDFPDDLAVAYGGTNAIAVWLGKGDGTFQFGREYPVGANPVSVVVGHFHDPEMADLAVANYDSDTVSILLGNGDGTFQEGPDIPVARGPIALAVGHFHDPHIDDLAVAHLYTDKDGDHGGVGVLLRNGNGTFQMERTYDILGGVPALVVGTFNSKNDDHDDIAVTTGLCCRPDPVPPRVAVLLGNGDGSFRFGEEYQFLRSTRSALAAADFNQDGRLDLAVANTESVVGGPDNTVTVLLGNGNGTFRFDNDYETGLAPSSVVAQDFNHDDFPDLATADAGDDTVSVLLNAADWSRRPSHFRALEWATGMIPAKALGQTVGCGATNSLDYDVHAANVLFDVGGHDGMGAPALGTITVFGNGGHTLPRNRQSDLFFDNFALDT
jgi:hypothetical protein